MKFERWLPIDQTSWVFKIYVKRLTHLNEMFWAVFPATSYMEGKYRREKKKGTYKIAAKDFLKVTGADSNRVASSTDDWYHDIREYDNWNRLNVLVSISALIEVYLSSVVSLSLESDPGVLLTIPKSIDGLTLLKKNGEKHNFNEQTKRITKGSWTARFAALKEIFPHLPQSLEQCISELDKMRVLRNKVAHGFGSDIELAKSRGLTVYAKPERLSLERMKKWMAVTNVFITVIDKYMLFSHIGEYEMLHYYHFNNSSSREFRKKINALCMGELRSNEYCLELIQYYNSIRV